MTKPESACGNEDSFWLDGETSVIREEADAAPTYDLEERRPRFGEAVIDFAKTIRQGRTTDRIISQLIGAATSVGANYIEADDSVSKKEFLKCRGSARKERGKQNISRAWRFAVPQLRPRSQTTVDGSERTASDFREDLAERKTKGMTKDDGNLNDEARMELRFRHWGFVINSSFVIRASSFF